MTPLITITDIRAVKSISLNTNEIAQLTPCILEAQDFDLRPLLGDEFYFAVADDLESYSDLFNGSTYTYNGNSYAHDGLKGILIYASYARYVANSNVIATATGFVNKTNQFSESVSEKTISRLIEQSRSAQQVITNRVLDYLNRNKAIYPLWKRGKEKTYKAGVKIKQIG